MSPITVEGNYSNSTAQYMLSNWRSFDENTNIAFEKALNVFDIVCENETADQIKHKGNILIDEVQKVRDANQLINSIKHRNSRFKSKITTKIKSKNEKINSSADDVTAKIKAALTGLNQPASGGTTSGGGESAAESEPTTEAVLQVFDSLLTESKKASECDRILRNYNNISKRFDLIKMVNESLEYDYDIDECVVKICECIDTYNSSFEAKYNTMLETSAYILDRSHVEYPKSRIVEMVTDYFVFNTIMEKTDIEDIKKVKNSSVMFNDCDFESIESMLINVGPVDKVIDPTRLDNDFNLNEAVNSYGAEDIVVLVENPVKDKVNEWKKGNPEEHKDDEIKKMISDFRNQCKDGNPTNNTLQFKSLVNKLFTKNADQIVNELPNLFSILRLFFIAGSCAIHPVISVVTLITDKIIQNHLERKQLERIVKIYKDEIERVKTKIEKAKSDEEKERMDKYLSELKKDLDKIKEYERNLYSDTENDERDFADYEFDDDEDWDFGDDEWNFDDDEFSESAKLINNMASIIRISDLVSDINEGLVDRDLDGIVYDNIFKFDNDTIDAITDFSITVPVILEKKKLCRTLEQYGDTLRGKNFMSNIMRIDCINENIRKLNNSVTTYNTNNSTKGIICTLNWINEMVSTTNCSYIMEMDLSNTIKLAMNKLKKNAVKLSDKEKKISNDIDVSMSSLSKSLEDALMNDNREAIIKGRVLPSASKTIKIALATGAAWAISPAVAVIGALGAFACSAKLKAKERQLVLDDIEIELKMCERYMKIAEDKDDMEAVRQIEITQRSLERQRQRIKYKMDVVYHQKTTPPSGSDDY
jgi:hypothetical protein